MPHCVIEYSRAIEHRLTPAQLVTSVHQSAVDSGLFDEASVKTRARPYDNYCLGGDIKDFIHVTLFILAGRNAQQKKQLSEGVLGALQTFAVKGISLTVQVADIDTPSYSKMVVD